MIRMKALKSANQGDGGMHVRRGREFQVGSEQRAKELESHGLAHRVQTRNVLPPVVQNIPENKAAENGPFASAGGMIGEDQPVQSSLQGQRRRTRVSRRSQEDK